MRSEKEILNEIEEIQEYLLNIRKVIIESSSNNERKNEAIHTINFLVKNIQKLETRNLIKDYLSPFFNISNLSKELPRILVSLKYLRERLEILDYHQITSVNSEEYYTKKINQLRERENELKQILNYNKNETEEQRKLAEETKEKLRIIENELNKKKTELELKEKQEDAKNDWEEKINDTFEQLKDYLNPIKKEHERLNILFYVFGFLSFITILLIIVIEINAVSQITAKELPTLHKFLILFLPLPIAGGLMWGFVFQMNRAQRQLILTANNIHSINYIQGLLISINNLSPNVNDSILRINKALDKIISNHLNNKYITNETDLINEENKDNIDIEKLLKLIKIIKSTTG